jgi:hypothetical protein
MDHADEFLTFEAGDVEIIGDVIEFDEEVQRGERVRFYTLDEQVNDAFEHMVPRGKTTRAQLEKLDKEVDRIRDLYSTYVAPTAEGYDVIVPKSLRSFPWISPVFVVSSNWSSYSFSERWNPLFAPDAIRQPNGYVRMLAALPRPYIASQGIVYPVDKPTAFRDEEGSSAMRVLPRFVMNKTRHHEDGRIDVLPVPVDGTEDTVAFKGYRLGKRKLNIPDPLPDHPFLSTNEARFIETTQPLSDVVPEMEAVLMHGVPVTTDPYGEGRKYLKVYDISLSSVPWELWKQRFPKVAIVDVMPAPIDMAFPEAKGVAPSSNIVEQYGQPYFPGVAVRKWLTSQEDGGILVVKMIQSMAGEAGTVASLPVSELGDLRFPDVDEDECILVGKTFNEFLNQGVVRQVGRERKCIPLDIVKQERHQIGYRDRIQWKESTSRDILAEYTRALAFFRRGKEAVKGPEYPKQVARAVSQLRQQVIAILADEERFPEDKLKAISVLTRDSPRTSQQIVDAEGQFVVCDHTIAILGGDMAKDRLAFYDTWTARVDGVRVCRACGEEVNNDVLVNQEDFSEEGRLLRHAEALDSHSFHGAATATYTNSLRAIQGLFDLEEPADGTMFLLVSLLQLLPAQDQILPVLQEAREISGAIKSKDREGKARGMVGIAATALLMQTHTPRLIPRRSFGPLPLKIDGFPRDTDSDKAPTIVDSLLVVLKKTFEAYPTSFKGPSVSVMRGVLSESQTIRKGVIAILKKMLPKFGAPLARAKAEALTNPISPPPVGLIPVMLPPQKLGVVGSFPVCAGPRSMWADPQPPKIRQPSVPYDSRIRTRGSTLPLRRTTIQVKQGAPIVAKDIQRRIKLASIPKTQGDTWRTNVLIAQRLSDEFELGLDTGSIDVSQTPDLLRDIAEGLVKEVMSVIVKDPVKKKAYEELREKDVTLFMLLATLKEATIETNSLRAKERHVFTDRMREMTDSQRQITKDLLDRGMAPAILTNADRDVFAEQIERELAPLVDPDDVGVGAPRDTPDDDDYNADQGDYGDHLAQGDRDHDRDMPELDREGPI